MLSIARRRRAHTPYTVVLSKKKWYKAICLLEDSLDVRGIFYVLLSI